MENKKKKILLFAVAGLGAAVGIYGLYRLLQKPITQGQVVEPLDWKSVIQSSNEINTSLAQQQKLDLINQLRNPQKNT